MVNLHFCIHQHIWKSVLEGIGVILVILQD